MNEQLTVGCHLSVSDGFCAMAETAKNIGANTFQFFTRNPRGGKAKKSDESDINKFLRLKNDYGIGKLIAHAPYTLNPCSADEKVRNFAFIAFEEDLKRLESIPGTYYNFHPGSHVGQGIEKGIELIVDLLNKSINEDMSAFVLLETMAGKGSEVGGKFEHFRDIISSVDCKNKIGVCLDTCHVYDGGYDIVDNLDGVLNEFDKVIGLTELKALHLNDSVFGFNSHKDRHAKIGFGCIGRDAFIRIINNPVLKNLPMCLETPNELDGYAEEIAFLRSCVIL